MWIDEQEGPRAERRSAEHRVGLSTRAGGGYGDVQNDRDDRRACDALGALFPDVDTAFGKHRKTLHNLPILIGFVAFPFVFGNLEYVWIGVLTHYVLDIAGSKRGIALFYPLWKEEFGLPIGVAVSSKNARIS